MIRSFRDRETEALFDRYTSKRWSLIARSALRKLRILHRAKDLDDLRVPPGTGWSYCVAIELGSIAFGSTINTVSVFGGIEAMHLTSN